MSEEPKVEILISRREIADAVDRLAEEIRRDYSGKRPLLLGILKGSFVFLADLVRCLDFPLEVEFVQLSSYGRERQSSGEISILLDVQTPIEGREVLLIEDIVDTGLTTGFLLEHLRAKKPASLRLCSLLDKASRREVPVNIDYLGFSVPDRFVVGYGIDFAEKYRYLPDVCALVE